MPPKSPAEDNDLTLVSFRLTADTEAPRRARRRAAQVLGEWELTPLEDAVIVCLSELVTNPVVQRASEISVLIERYMDMRTVDVYVWDNAPGAPKIGQPDSDSEGGRGLHIVAALAKEWGHFPSVEGGKVVWARFHVGDGERDAA